MYDWFLKLNKFTEVLSLVIPLIMFLYLSSLKKIKHDDDDADIREFNHLSKTQVQSSFIMPTRQPTYTITRTRTQ